MGSIYMYIYMIKYIVIFLVWFGLDVLESDYTTGYNGIE